MPLPTVLGDPRRTHAVGVALRRVHIHTRHLTTAEARRAPGFTVGVPLVLLTWPPGTHPDLELEIFTSGTGGAHVWWDDQRAGVGPFFAPHLGPCPTCVGADQPRQSDATHPALEAWATASIALEAQSILEQAITALVATGWCWDLNRPGLDLLQWSSVLGCQAPGCVNPDER